MVEQTDRAGIGIMNEMSVHSALKELYYAPGDLLEAKVDRYVVDLVKPDRLVEIQSGNFSSIRGKLEYLLQDYVVHLVYPVAEQKYLVYTSPDDDREISRRKSPKKGTVWDVFSELVYIPKLITHPNLYIEVILIVEEEIRCADGKGSWRRNKVSIVDRRLSDVVEHKVFLSPEDYAAVLPSDLPSPFSNNDLAKSLKIPVYQARRITYTLREAGIIQLAGKTGNQLLYIHQD